MSNGKLYTSLVSKLSTEGADGPHVGRKVRGIGSIDVRAAKQTSDDLEAMIFFFEAETLDELESWPPPPSQGWSVSSGKGVITLQLLESRYRDVFLIMSDDICDLLVSSSSELDSLHLLHDRLGCWQSFMKLSGPEGLGRERSIGLYGELLVMRDLMIPQFGTRASVSGWRGFKKAPQDFQVPGFALEVKTTTASIPDRIHISNVQQLDNQGPGHMILTLVHLDRNESSGDGTLPEIVDELRTMLPDTELDLFNAGLIEVGYHDMHRDLYEHTYYVLKQRKHYEVVEDFPHITLEMIPEGVKSVKYSISIDACGPFELEEDALLELILRMESPAS